MRHSAAAPLLALFAITACSSTEDETLAAPVCTPLPDGTSQSASFAADIAPLWERKCTGFLCHLPPNDAADDEAFLSAWVSQPSAVVEALLIVPGDPKASFLMHKLDATHDCGDFTCSNGACGEAMPIGEPLTVDERALFRGWITAGAAAD